MDNRIFYFKRGGRVYVDSHESYEDCGYGSIIYEAVINRFDVRMDSGEIWNIHVSRLSLNDICDCGEDDCEDCD